jgi:hypothetical protein
MNTPDIRRILREDVHAGPLFSGVFARDAFVEFARRRQRGDYAAVFNTHVSGRPGEHWIAYVRRNGEGWYFDSYGRPPDAYPDVTEALANGRSVADGVVLWNGERLQGLSTSACGDYCVLFILLCCRGWTFERILTRLTRIPDSERRDHAVRATLLRLYGPTAITTLREGDADYVGRDRLHIASVLKLTGLRFPF